MGQSSHLLSGTNNAAAAAGRSSRAKTYELPAIGPYILSETLGTGAYAVVKLGTHRITGVRVAVKIIDRTLLNDPTRMVRIVREVAVLRMLDHPHITRLLDAVETDAFFALVMEFVPGQDLFKMLKGLSKRRQLERMAKGYSGITNASTGLALDRTFRIFYQLVSALDCCHANGIAHRDVKVGR